MRDNQDLNQAFIKAVCIPFKNSQKFKNGDLQKRILDASNFIFCIVFKNDHFIGFSKFGYAVDNIFDERFIQTDYVFKESHCAQKNSMILFFKTSQNFWKELSNILRALLDDSDGS